MKDHKIILGVLKSNQNMFLLDKPVNLIGRNDKTCDIVIKVRNIKL
jgi:hypothetical protein